MDEVGWIINFMGNPCHELSDAGHFFGLDDLGLGAFKFLEGDFEAIGVLTKLDFVGFPLDKKSKLLTQE